MDGKLMTIHHKWLEKVIINALEEDLGPGWNDLTTRSILDLNTEVLRQSGDDKSQTKQDKTYGKSVITAKETGIIAGGFTVEQVFKTLSSEVRCERLKREGEQVLAGDEVIKITGPLDAILMGERTALNFFQRLSGIATKTRKLVDLITPYSCELLDTRKTTPGIRALEKYAVTIGGGTNHRIGLFDGVMIKDNHIKAAGSITNAIKKVKQNIGPMTKISVEASDFEKAVEAKEKGADMILLDNMTPTQLSDVVTHLKGEVILEASGNVTEENVQAIASSGVDYISTGSVTHSAKALDLSLTLQTTR